MEGVIGEVRMFGGNFAPRTWAFCQGQLMAISSNQALFSILGTTYGGDGRTTFGLPDLRGRGPIQPGTGPGLSTHKLGSRSGEEVHTLTIPEMPSHTHLTAVGTITGTVEIKASTTGTTGVATDNYWSKLSSGPVSGGAYDTSADTTMNPGAITVDSMSATGTVGLTGGSQPHANMQPFLVVNYIICLTGIFPSRS